jgi:lipopolysaccharide export system permease protein
MKLLTRYLAREIYASTALVFTALLLLFAFLDFVNELNALGQEQYSLAYVLLYVGLTLPGRIYELFPVAALIGTILALVQMAAHSELTVYRASGASLLQMLGALGKIALPLVLACFIFGEFIAPPSEHLAQQLRLKAKNLQVSLDEFRSGVWVKDDNSFVNVKNVMPDSSLLNIVIYKLDVNYHLQSILNAKRANYVDKKWQLDDVHEIQFSTNQIKQVNANNLVWNTSLNPQLFNVLLVVPEQMSGWNLYQYVNHLRDNHQQTVRYEIAMWGKLMYPLAVLVMMVLALPFGAHHHRSSGIGGKIFMGIVLGLSFHFFGRLFGSLGALYDWPPLFSASAISVLFLIFGVTMLWFKERR